LHYREIDRSQEWSQAPLESVGYLVNMLPLKKLFVQTHDEKPKRRLFETLRSRGMQMNQDVTFLSDGGDDVRALQYYLNPQAEHILDWFHVTMKITAMRQIAKGIEDTAFMEKMLASLDRVKWRLWHGHVANALDKARGPPLASSQDQDIE
jgi:hypothetical protein